LSLLDATDSIVYYLKKKNVSLHHKNISQ